MPNSRITAVLRFLLVRHAAIRVDLVSTLRPVASPARAARAFADLTWLREPDPGRARHADARVMGF